MSKENKVSYLADLVVIRNHLYQLCNSMSRNVLGKGDYPKISRLVSELDKEVIRESLSTFSEVAVPSADDLSIKAKIEEAKKALQNANLQTNAAQQMAQPAPRSFKKAKSSESVVVTSLDNGELKLV